MTHPVIDWLLDDAREADDDGAWLVGLAAQLVAAGVRVSRISTSLRPLDPRIWVRNLRWERGQLFVEDREREIRTSVEYIGSPIEAIHGGAEVLRERLDGAAPPRFHTLGDFARRGATDYVIRAIRSRDAMRSFISYTTDAPGGFTEDELGALAAIHPAIATSIRLRTSRMTTGALLRTYLGANAADRVLAGEVTRGGGETISAAIWFCDLRDFTGLSDALSPPRLLHLLDRYFEAMAHAVVDHGGEILKFIGDAMLAIFPAGEAGAADACRHALAAAEAALARFDDDVPALEPDRELGCGISLHLGEVFYGNIGARERLDFTVIGPAVNLAARVQGLCSTLGTPLIMTAAFAAHVAGPLHPLGTRPLKGIASPPALVTLPRLAPR